jgi:hypothetical protein
MGSKGNLRLGILLLALTLLSVAFVLFSSPESVCLDQTLIEGTTTDFNYVLVPEITNSSHMHPWLATTISILFLGFIVFIIILCGDKAG